MAIIKLMPSYKHYIWGGTKLKSQFHKNCEEETVAESWELSCHVDGASVIAEGKFSGKTLQEYISWEGKKILGSNCMRFPDFPIMIKLIDAKENLSIQVHPGDEYALSKEGQFGKTEMWYVADCEPGAYLYYGFREKISREELQKRIGENTLLEILNKVSIKKGDVFFIEAGVVHAIGKGTVIAEIQQNSNLTYRVYDYGRLDKNGRQRDLHIEKALDVMKYEPVNQEKTFEPHLGCCEYFMVDKISLDGKFVQKISGSVEADSFLHLLILEGDGVITDGEETRFQKGDSILITAATGTYGISGKCQALLTTIPYAEG